MAGFRRFKLFLGIIIPFFAFFLMSQNVEAVALDTSSFDLHYAANGSSSYLWQNGMKYGQNTGGTQGINYVNLSTGYGFANLYQFNTSAVNATGNYMTINFETNIVVTGASPAYRGEFVNLPYMSIQVCTGTGAFSNMQLIDKSLSSAVTEWNDGKSLTLTFYGSASYRNIGQGSSGIIVCQIGNPNYAFLTTTNAFSTTYINRVFFEQNPGSIEFSNNINDALLQMQVNQNNTIINQNQQILDQNQAVIDQDNSAYDSISGQDANNIDGSTNAQTASLISVISGFISAFSSINPTNCDMNLELPDFAGGSRLVNICSGKENAPQIIEIGSSLLLICVFVPLAFVVIKMIYSEIRSWTNG